MWSSTHTPQDGPHILTIIQKQTDLHKSSKTMLHKKASKLQAHKSIKKPTSLEELKFALVTH